METLSAALESLGINKSLGINPADFYSLYAYPVLLRSEALNPDVFNSESEIPQFSRREYLLSRNKLYTHTSTSQ